LLVPKASSAANCFRAAQTGRPITGTPRSPRHDVINTWCGSHTKLMAPCRRRHGLAVQRSTVYSTFRCRDQHNVELCKCCTPNSHQCYETFLMLELNECTLQTLRDDHGVRSSSPFMYKGGPLNPPKSDPREAIPYLRSLGLLRAQLPYQQLLCRLRYRLLIIGGNLWQNRGIRGH
jgi:hypothetical protein